MGFDPLSWCRFKEFEDKSELALKFAETAQIVEHAVDSVKASLLNLIHQKLIFGKIESNPDGLGSYFIKEKEERTIQEGLKENLLGIEKFLKEFYPKVVFYRPPSIITRIDEIIVKAKNLNLDSLVKEAEDLKNEFFKET